MDQYGYLFNKFARDVKQFSNQPNISIKQTSKNTSSGSMILVVICIIIFIGVFRLA
jgi:hypothetical protein